MPILSYEDFRRQFPTLINRYSPDVSESYHHARSALQFRERDVNMTAEELDGLIRYCENAFFGEAEDVPPTNSIEERIAQLNEVDRSYLIDYKWCEQCRKMMAGSHNHCPSCNIAVNGNGNPCGRCRNCCNCLRCNRCGSHYPPEQGMTVCNSCQSCRNCCKCVPCRYDGCQTGQKVSCNNCGGCRGCCQCNKSAYGKPWRASRSNKRTKFDCPRLVGVEWEFNRVNDRIPMQSWVRNWRGRIQHDGSCGEEIVTPPMAGDFMVECLTDLGESFKKAGGSADNRCSIHVHVDSRDVCWKDLRRLVVAYSKYEGFLYMLGGEHRALNRYCKPCGRVYGDFLKLKDWKEKIINEALATTDGRHRLNGGDISKKANGRYRGLNLCPWLVGRARKESDTTIEFRIHENTLDSREVVYWTQTLARLVEWCTTATDEQANSLPDNPIEGFKIISPETVNWIEEKTAAWKKQFTRGDDNNISSSIISFKNSKFTLGA